MAVAPAQLRDVSAEFPVLRREIDGHPVTYLDSAATSQTPQPVIDAMTRYYTDSRASIHRGVYPLAVEATDLFEGARQRIADWLGSTTEETIFTANATMAINLVAYTWARQNVGAGDLVVLTEMEHHSNIVPWQLLCAEKGATLRYVRITDDGHLDLESLDELLSLSPKLVGVVHVSNVLGTINPVAEIARRAHRVGARVMIDGSQAVPQIPVDLREIDADFYAWTGHKAYGPTGIGVLYGRRELLEEMPPFIGGGHMIRRVDDEMSTWTDLPWKFEAGTSQIAEAIGLGAAVDWLVELGIDRVREHEESLVGYALERLHGVPGLSIQGPTGASERGSLVSFTVEGAHPHDVGEILGRRGVCVRAGHHCTQPLMRRLGVGATTRASFAVHNTTADIDRLIEGLGDVRRVLDL
ncbi:MAG TPA: SufS family cysteine desulfurase [Solirubrobacteraceae bacterium]|jgi:cysteine desulfurase/selenocysteine lyase|nr:SufS family cysteine desulfurase [Solirubrobacteraceae bacterium]